MTACTRRISGWHNGGHLISPNHHCLRLGLPGIVTTGMGIGLVTDANALPRQSMVASSVAAVWV